MVPHSGTLAWKIPWTEEPGRLQSMGSLRVRQGWATSLSLFTFMHWRRKWQPTPVFLPGESQGLGSLMGFCLWGRRVGHDWSDLAAAATEEQKVRTDKWVWWLEREARDEWAKNNSEVLLFDVSMDMWGNGDKLCTWLWLYREQYVDYHIRK